MVNLRLNVEVIRDGPTVLDWERKRLTLRKPRSSSADSFRYVQAKCDGFRVVVVRSYDTQKVHVITSTGIDIGEKCEQTVWAHQLWKRLPDLHWFDGEIYVPGAGREAVSTALADRNPALRFAAFGYSHAPLSSSMQEVERIIDHYNCAVDVLPWSEIGSVSDRPSGLLRSTTEDASFALERVSELGPHFDGVVLKNGMYSAWAKLKHKRTIDLVVVGTKPGKGKYANMVGSLVGGVYSANVLFEVACVSGMDDDVREAITDDDVDRVFEVEYERVGARGRLQHPRFLRFRDDKTGPECTIDQDPELSKVLA